MPAFRKAGPAEILRAVQKDETFLNYLKSRVADIIKKTVGTRWWLLYHNVVEICCESIYYGVTTLSLRQTLGEEYTGILQVKQNTRHLPTFIARLLMVLLHCGGQFALYKLVNKLEKSLKSGALSSYLRPEIKSSLLQQIPILRTLPSFLMRVHLAAFYLRGNFYHVSKRISGINYVLTRNWFGDNSVRRSFRILGIVLTANILLSLCYTLYEVKRKQRNMDKPISDAVPEPSKRCPLCLGKRQFPAVTVCGHLFCWYCIHEWLQTSSVCPLCRHPVTSPEVIPLINYS